MLSMNSKEYSTAIYKLEAWAHNKGYSVCCGLGEDAYLHEDKQIIFNTNLKSKKNQIYSLLHECGHALAYNSKDYKNKFPNLAAMRFKEVKVNKRRNAVKCEIIAEELDAWKRGLKLAGRLKININKEDYDNYASRWVMTYIRRHS
jgi:hypothetical protein